MATPLQDETPWDAFLEAHGLDIEDELRFESWLISQGIEPMHQSLVQLNAAYKQFQRGKDMP